MYDFDGNGEFTNEGEDMSQWEIGALKVANRAGKDWLGNAPENKGFIYWPYRLIGSTENGDYPIDTLMKVDVYEVEPNYTPKRLLKEKLSHNNRKILIFKITDENNSSNGRLCRVGLRLNSLGFSLEEYFLQNPKWVLHDCTPRIFY